MAERPLSAVAMGSVRRLAFVLALLVPLWLLVWWALS